MAKRDYYEILGVSRSAAGEEIKRSYRRLALKFHPDRNPGDRQAEASFKEVSEAYEILSNPDRRRLYDQFGHEGLKGRGFGFHDPADIFRDFFEGLGGSIFGDFFGMGSARAAGPVRGRDVDYRLEMSLEEAAFGFRKKIEYFRRGTCSRCGGGGSEPGREPELCSACGGSGRVRQARQSLFGTIATEVPCARCGGRGRILRDPCRDCRGEGTVEENVEMNIEIPPGVSDGLILRKQGAGEAGLRGGGAGALNLHISVRRHEVFERRGDDIHCDFAVPFTLAALGGAVPVPTLKGEAELKVPPGTQGGEEIRLKGKGIPHLHGSGRGDEIVRVVVETPVNLSSRQKDILRRFAESLERHNSPSGPGLFQRLRRLVRR